VPHSCHIGASPDRWGHGEVKGVVGLDEAAALGAVAGEVPRRRHLEASADDLSDQAGRRILPRGHPRHARAGDLDRSGPRQDPPARILGSVARSEAVASPEDL